MKKARDSRFKLVLGRALEKIKPSEHDLNVINKVTDKIVMLIREELKKQRIAASVFIGGSLAKGTLLKRERYDIDIFVRFDYKKYLAKDAELSQITEKFMKKVFLRLKLGSKECFHYKLTRIHGSRDYFQITFLNKEIKSGMFFEIVPVLAIDKPNNAKNVTDLSFLHVNYIKKQISKKAAKSDDILLAKFFCYAHNCYGAESYIRGFSGYALEVLVIYYGSFANFINAVISWDERLKDGKKIIIDPSKHYKKAGDVLLDMNEAKLISPIIVVDPTYHCRNVTAAVSAESIKRLIEACRKFKKTPNLSLFKKQEVDIQELRKASKKKKAEFAVIEATADKPKEDIAAAKLLKFFNFLLCLIEKNELNVIKKEIKFNKKQGLLYLIYKKPLGKVLVRGPPASLAEHVLRFKKSHKKIFIKKGIIYASEKRRIIDIRDIIQQSITSSQLKDMGIVKLRLVR